MGSSRRFACKNCEFVGQNRRALARHMTEKHEEAIHKCPYPLCNFVSCYKTNLMRHARDVHGLHDLNCELCGFFANSIEEFIQHREANHKDDLERLEKIYEQEKQRLAADNSELDNPGSSEAGDPFEEFEFDPEMFGIIDDNSSTSTDQPSLDSNSLHKSSSDPEKKKESSESKALEDLGCPKEGQFFTCETCGQMFPTPKEMYRHQKDAHHENFMVYECEHCNFASKQLHKFHRHLNLVHKDKLQETTAYLTNFAQQKTTQPLPHPPPPSYKRYQDPSPMPTTSSHQISLHNLPPPPPLSQHRLPQLSPRPNSRPTTQPLIPQPPPQLTLHAPQQQHPPPPPLTQSSLRMTQYSSSSMPLTHSLPPLTRNPPPLSHIPQTQPRLVMRPPQLTQRPTHLTNSPNSAMLQRLPQLAPKPHHLTPNPHISISQPRNSLNPPTLSQNSNRLIQNHSPHSQNSPLMVQNRPSSPLSRSPSHFGQNKPPLSQSPSRSLPNSVSPSSQSLPSQSTSHYLSHTSQLSQHLSRPPLTSSSSSLNSFSQSTFASASTPHSSSPSSTIIIDQKPFKRSSETTFSCSMCHFQTRSKFLLLQHEKTTHTKKRFFKCKQCGYITNKRIRYMEHMKDHEGPPTKLKCTMCGFSTHFKGNFEKHMRSHFEDTAFSCGECSFSTNNKQKLMDHLNSHLGESNEQAQVHEEEEEEEENGEIKMTEFSDNFNKWSPQVNKTFKELQHTLDSITQKPENMEMLQARQEELSYKQGKYYLKSHKCRFCPFKAAFPYEIAKHEASHESFLIKRHPCPLCGVRFYHLTGLARHVSEEHRDDANAKSIVACAEMLSEQRKKKRRLKSPPADFAVTESNGPQANVAPTVTFTLNPDLEIIQQPAASSRQPAPPPSEVRPSMEIINISPQIANSMLDTKTPTCHICGHKTKWISELIKHIRVHSNERPFKCKVCSYECKWKGDLNRHMKLQGHGEPLPEGEGPPLPSISISPENKSLSKSDQQPQSNDSAKFRKILPKGPLPANPGEMFSKAFPNYQRVPIDDEGKTSSSLNQANGPLEITIDVKTLESEPEMESPNLCDPLVIAEPPKIKSKSYLYKCPHCTFLARTASRFHVHIIQHLNTRPFMCSICGYRSNWQWDITKHLKMKGLKDTAHGEGKVLLTHETGMRDYGKYKEYLIEVDSEEEGFVPVEDMKKPSRGSETSDSPKKSNDGESIVVTPDIAFPEEAEAAANGEFPIPPSPPPLPQMLDHAEKLFRCAHCSYQKSSKKVVVSHLGFHAGIKPYVCRFCGLTSNWPNTVIKHLKLKHDSDSRNMDCRIKYSQNKNVLRLEGIIPLDENAVPDTSSDGITRTEGEVPMYNCEHCPYKCEKLYHMKFHMKQHKPREGAIFKCMFCPYYVKFRKSLILHMRLHGVANEEKGDRGDSSNNHSLSTNEDTHNFGIMKKYSCQHCPYKTDNKSQFLYHKQFHRPNKTAPFKCSLCTYWTSRHHLLLQHIKIHKPQSFSPNKNAVPEKKPLELEQEIPVVKVKKGDVILTMFKCRFCPMKTQRRKTILIHEKMHLNVKGKHACTHCSYQTDNQGALGAHMKWHTKPAFSKEEETVSSRSIERVPPLRLSLNSISSSSPKKNSYYSLFCDFCPAAFKSTRDLLTHQTFHGSVYPHECPNCNYRAKHKLHLSKHLIVHTPEYIESHVRAKEPEVYEFAEESSEEISQENDKSAANQLLLLEEVEMKQQINNNVANKLHRCLLCPAAFTKSTTLNFHMSLHGSIGEYKCQQCDYEVNSSQNFAYHEQLHYKSKAVYKPKVYTCDKCPATFTKIRRFEKHQGLHGKNNKFPCEKCDYSSNFLGMLTKHKLLHKHEEFYVAKSQEYPKLKIKKASTPPQSHVVEEVPPPPPPRRPGSDELKMLFTCDYCPYVHTRKDRMTRHLKRHGDFIDGVSCPYCDFNATQLAFLKDHIKLHLQGQQLNKPQAYIKFENSEIWSFNNQSKHLLFKENTKDSNSEERFYPPLHEDLVGEKPAHENLAKKAYSEIINRAKSPTDEEETDIDYDLAKMNTSEETSQQTTPNVNGYTVNNDKDICDNYFNSDSKSSPLAKEEESNEASTYPSSPLENGAPLSPMEVEEENFTKSNLVPSASECRTNALSLEEPATVSPIS